MKRNEICANPSNLRGVKIKLYPTEDQKKILFRQIELFRWVYNWMLELEIDALNTTGLFISHSDVERQFQQLRKENAYLRDLLNYVPPPTAISITSRVIADTGNSFAQSLIAFVGHRQEIEKGNVVLTGDGLVGRIASVGTNAARILLITDINSRVPVKIEPYDVPAILAGDNTEYPQLISFPNNTEISVGDKVVTSGMAGVYPAGLPVGVIVSVQNGIIKVRPFFNRNRLEIVHIVDYGLSGLLEDQTCDISH